MKVLVINGGSSSLKYQLINMVDESVLCKGIVERIGEKGSKIKHQANGKKFEIEKDLANHTESFNLLIDCLTDKEMGVIASVDEIGAVGHRVVQSGELYDSSIYVDDKAIENIQSISHLAPLHNPANIACINSCKAILPNVPNVAVFDTGFHSTMPMKAKMYGIPYEDYKQYQLRRYGAHGTSHKFVSNEAINYLNSIGAKSDCIVTCHLGNGSSISAVKNGKCIDTSMGLTPLAGVCMGTRCGDIDPALVEMLATLKGMTMKEVITYLNKESGFKGISGIGSDARDLWHEFHTNEQGKSDRAGLTIDVFAYQVKKYIGSYTASMNGLDCIVMTGGIGENDNEFREEILKDLEFLGVELDKDINDAKSTRGNFTVISTPTSRVKVIVIPTNEEVVIARETKEIVENLNK